MRFAFVQSSYGYIFDFVVNGDSSPISVDEENVVTNWNYDLY